MGELLWLPAHAFEPENIADARRGGNNQSEPGSVRRRAVTNHGLFAAGHVCFFAGGRVKGTEVCSAFFAVQRNNALAVAGPHRWSAATATRRGIIATDPRTEIVIEIEGESSRLCIR